MVGRGKVAQNFQARFNELLFISIALKLNWILLNSLCAGRSDPEVRVH